jgi:hypothetical protein
MLSLFSGNCVLFGVGEMAVDFLRPLSFNGLAGR